MLHIPASIFYIQMSFPLCASTYLYILSSFFSPASAFVCFWKHNGWRNCPSFSLRYWVCFVTKVTWELIIWHIIFLQVSFWKIGFWQICHFVNRLFDIFVIWWVGCLLSLLFIELVIPIIGYHLIDLEPEMVRSQQAPAQETWLCMYPKL